MTAARWVRATFAAAAAAASLATSTVVRAGDGNAPKPSRPTPLALHLAADKSYGYVFTEKVHAWSTISSAAGESKTDQKSEATWELELRLVEAKADGGAVVALKVTRLHGTYENLKVAKRTFDSATDAADGSLALTKDATRVTLSAAGRVLDVDGSALKSLNQAKDEALAKRATAERFFQTLPPKPVRVGLVWEDTRAIAPDMVESGQHLEGEFAEKVTITKVGAFVVASLSGKGKKKLPRRRMGQKVEGKPPLGALEEWSVTGETTIDAATGLATLRRTHVEAATYSDFILVRDMTLESNVEYDTRLEAVPPK